MARVRKGIVVTLTLLVHSTCVYAGVSIENGNFKISWKGVLNKNYEDPLVSSDCMNYFICNNTYNYPEDLAKWAIKELNSAFNLTRYTIERKAVVREEKILQLCDSKEEIIYPTAASSNLNEGWYFILNLSDFKFQGYHVNKCMNLSSCQGLSSSKKSVCEQEYTDRSMIYFDLKEQFVSKKTFKVPSCCSCAVYF